jgi:dipeptidyl aminopeptidase/acylaminoacyl peptidase
VSESASAGYAPFNVSENGIVSFATAGADTIELTWKDRDGTTLGTIGDAGDYRDLSAFAPDGRRVVLSRTTNSNRDIWVIDTGRPTTARVTFGPSTEADPAWSPDGKWIAFNGASCGEGLYQKAADGSGDERLLTKLDGAGGVNDRLSDGRFIAYRADGRQTQADVWIVPTDGHTKPFVLLQTRFLLAVPRQPATPTPITVMVNWLEAREATQRGSVRRLLPWHTSRNPLESANLNNKCPSVLVLASGRTRSCPPSAPAAWARCIERVIRSSVVTSPSRFCRRR